MSQTADILPNALVQNVCPNVMVQSRMRNSNVKWIVRGYLWGSLATSCERGDRTPCGSTLPNGLHRFQKLDVPLFTPTTKADVGHDEDMTSNDMVELFGNSGRSKPDLDCLSGNRRSCVLEISF